ncbi:MATE family efflux transporter [Vibrio sp. SCSIO 43136]|uniref:MATE family efflux transporter n=1 Tax=Vibrio sp. SCSIO 43136 TaxID=2819101 RepID=UPI0020760551|nr:MATE family efflux transporter [Vibrio sp. SCSIO 43136]USD66595.1 MATE family efflux transporter [Vibrio sp. SCSIO 43136]
MYRYKNEASALIKLASPVLIASVSQTGMGFVDTVMAGGVSPTDMAAVAVATSVWLPTILFGIGLIMALVPIIAQLNGAGKTKQIPFEVQQGVFLALLITLPVVLVLAQTQFILGWMNVEDVMAEKATGYMYAMMTAAPAFLLFQVLRSYTDGMSLTKPAMVIGFVGLVLNIPLNWMFVYGKLGMPALGGVGCGVATTIVYWSMLAMMLIYILRSKRLSKVGVFDKLIPPQVKAIKRLFGLGLPVAASMFFEVTLFAVVALLIAPLGSMTVAAHQVAMNFSSLVFMLPLSIATAVSIRVGHKMGEESVEGAMIASRVGIVVGLLMAMTTAVFTVVFREQIAELYTDDPEVILMAGSLMFLAAVYQCTDSVQIIAGGALRGYKDMKAIFVRTFISYWVFGLPSGYLLGATTVFTHEPLGAPGYWIGIIIGLSIAALMLGQRLLWMHRQEQSVQLEFAAK